MKNARPSLLWALSFTLRSWDPSSPRWGEGTVLEVLACPPFFKGLKPSISSKPCLCMFYSAAVGRESQDFGGLGLSVFWVSGLVNHLKAARWSGAQCRSSFTLPFSPAPSLLDPPWRLGAGPKGPLSRTRNRTTGHPCPQGKCPFILTASTQPGDREFEDGNLSAQCPRDLVPTCAGLGPSFPSVSWATCAFPSLLSRIMGI